MKWYKSVLIVYFVFWVTTAVLLDSSYSNATDVTTFDGNRQVVSSTITVQRLSDFSRTDRNGFRVGPANRIADSVFHGVS